MFLFTVIQISLLYYLNNKNLLHNFQPKQHTAHIIHSTKGRIQLSLRCIRSLGYPEYVHIYYSKEPKQLLLVPCKQNEDDAIRITRFGERSNFTINRTHLVKLIKEIAGTEENRKYLGEYDKEYGGMLFDLSDSKQIGYSVPLKKNRPLPRARGNYSIG